jgi:hypothetical protein
MSEQEQIYPSATKELIEQRKNLAPNLLTSSKLSVRLCSPRGHSPRRPSS